MATQHLFAKGHGNLSGLVALYDLAPPLFRLYQIDCRTIWRPYAERVRDASLRDIPLGLPSVIFVFPVVSDAELRLLRTTFFDGDNLEAAVTIQTYDYDYLAWLPYNGLMRWPDLNDLEHDRGHWRDVQLEVAELRLISGFDDGFDPLAFGV